MVRQSSLFDFFFCCECVHSHYFVHPCIFHNPKCTWRQRDSVDSAGRWRQHSSREDVSRSTVDQDLAQLALTRSVSSAHLSNFRSSGEIILRHVVAMNPDPNNRHQQVPDHHNHQLCYYYSAAAGIACRLLQTPAVRNYKPKIASPSPSSLLQQSPYSFVLRNEESMLVLRVYVEPFPSWEEDVKHGVMDFANHRDDATVTPTVRGGGALAPGDGFAQIIYTKVMMTINQNENDDNCQVRNNCNFYVVPCSAKDSRAVFADPFFGTRGETPTTVIQWSKGTIF